MEKFKAVEKEMKTKAYSKEGLQLAAKMDPREREKVEMCNYLSDCVDSLERQIEQLESEAEGLQATQKKGKKGSANAERILELERQMERHKWHQTKLELLLRTLENGGIEADEVKTMQDDINYYVEGNQEVDFMEDDTIYDHLTLQEEEEIFGLGVEADRVSSQDAQSLADDAETELKPTVSGTGKSKVADAATTGPRRPSTQLKSPLPALASLHAPMSAATNGVAASGMKPAPPPARTPGEPLKYASAAAAAAASDHNELGIAPLPAPPAKAPPTGSSPATIPATIKTVSPSMSQAQPSAPQPQRNASQDSQPIRKSPIPGASPAVAINEPAASAPESVEPNKQESKKTAESSPAEEAAQPSTPALTNGDTHSEVEEDESIYHLPSSLNDLLESFEATKSNAAEAFSDPTSQRLFAAGYTQAPDAADAERPRHYRPQHPYPYTPVHFPQEPSPIFDDPRLYSRVDTDTLFYAFYYRQGTYQQYLSAKALKNQSWRFHKQYQTWFQRHEEPKSITEDYEQGTYRFFDYESTW
jgi:CCR4-NOT transcription complex subunit 3